MGITCVIECFRVLAYYRCHDEINNTWADFFCFVRLSPPSSSSSLYVVEQLQTAHRPAVVSPLSVCRSAGGVWESGENGRTGGLVIEINKVRFISSSTWTRPQAQKPRLLMPGWTAPPEFYLFETPQRPSTLPASSFDGRSELFFDFFFFRNETRGAHLLHPLLT